MKQRIPKNIKSITILIIALITVSASNASSESSLRIYQPGDYLNYKVTGFINQGGVDTPIFGTAQFKVLDETQNDYYYDSCKIFRMTIDFTFISKDRSNKVKRTEDQYFTQDADGAMMFHGTKNNEGLLALVKSPSAGRYYGYKRPSSINESSAQNIIYTDGSTQNRTNMILGAEQVSVPAGEFKTHKSISNILTIKTDSRTIQAIETAWLEPTIGLIRLDLEYPSDKGAAKFILEMTDTNVAAGKKALPPSGPSIIEAKKVATEVPERAGTTAKEVLAVPPLLVKSSTPAPDLCRNVVAEKRFKKDAIEWSEKSEKMSATKNWSEMIRIASVAIVIDPCYPAAYVNRSWGYIEKGFLDEAFADCQKALELDTNSAGAYNNRGLYYLRVSDQAKARDDFEKACHGGLEIGCENFKFTTGYKPSEKIAYLLNKAEVAFNAKNWDEVIRFTSEIPDDVTALSVRAGAYAYKGMFEEAIKDCDQAIRINPDYSLAYNNKAFALELKGNKKEAILNYEFACNLKMDLACKNMKALENKK